MQSQGRRVVVALATAAIFVAAFFFFAPSQIGGPVTYSITAGNSMEPMLHKNSLVLVRAQPSYKVGDVVLYQSSVLHRPVLHRILVIQNGHYFFKGDHNNFVDPGYATRGELTGKLWFHIPAAGGILAWIGTPWHAALLAALTAGLLILGGVSTGRRRNRERGPAPRQRPLARRPRYLTPVTGATLTVLSALILIGLVLAGVGFGSPSTRPVATANAFAQTGTFSYTARPIVKSAFYPHNLATTGQPLLANVIDTTNFVFKYRFVSKLEHQIHGTIELKALILSQASTWQNLYPVEAKDSFKGDTAQTGGSLKLSSLFALLTQISTASGAPGATFSVDLQPIVHIVGTVDGKPIDSTFSPALPFSATSLQIRPDVVAPVPLPGASYKPTNITENAALTPVQSGSIPGRAANTVAIARYQVPVFTIRWLGLVALAFAAFVAIFHDRLIRRQLERPQEEQIAAHLGCLVTPTDALPLPANTTPIPVHDFLSLARLARYLERPILRNTIETGTTYAVADDAGFYEFHAAPAVRVEPAAQTRSAPVKRSDKRLGRRSRITIAGVGLAVVIAITLVTSFTATTTVPTSNVGASNQPRQVSQLTPAGCASLSLTTIVFAEGKFTNTASNVLLLGTAGSDAITDNGHTNCIVGGAGKDKIDAKPDDFCQAGADKGSTYTGCTKF